MTAASAILAGARILAAQIQDVAPTAAYKAATQSVTSSTTLQNDDALYLGLPADSTWVFIGLLSMTGNTIGDGDFQGEFTAPAGATVTVEAIGYNTTTAGPLNGNEVRGEAGVFTAGVHGTAPSPLVLIGSVAVGPTAGVLQLEWCQNTSSATATNVLAGSFLAAWQVA